MEDDPSEEVVVRPPFSGNISLLGYEDGSFCVIGTQYDWELGMINLASFPIDLWLCHGKPWVTEDCFLFSKFCEVEPKIGVVGPHLNLQVGVVVELSTLVFHTIDIKQLPQLVHSFDGKLQPFCVCKVHEVFGST